MYKVIQQFKDRDGRVYNVGDEYSNDSEERLTLLSTSGNRYGYPFIEKVKKQRKKAIKEEV